MSGHPPISGWILLLSLTLSGCAPRPPASDYPRVASYALEDTAATPLARAYKGEEARHPGMSGFHLLTNGPEALMMRIALAEASRKSIDMQYYSTRDDTTGKLLLEAVIRAADRGVRVRLLLDDWNLDDFEAGAVALNAHPNISIRVFNPYATRDQSIFSRIGNVFSYMESFNRHMHNKALIVDNHAAIMGGRNLGDEYFEASDALDYRDVDVLAVGPVTRSISRNFDRYWNSSESFPIEILALPRPDPQAIADIQAEMRSHWQAMYRSSTGKNLRRLPLPHKAKDGGLPLIWAKAELAADSPAKITQDDEETVSVPAMRIEELVRQARHEFVIFTPYFVPLDDGMDWLNALEARGVAVRIVTNSLSSTDVVPAQAGYGHYREALLKGGVDLYEIKSVPPKTPAKHMFKPSSQTGLHAKIYMIDRRDAVIGSFNLDPRSKRLNTEQVLVIHSPALCAQIASFFDDVTSPESSYHVIPAAEVPADQQPLIHGSLAWETEEDGETAYFDFNPHAGFWRNLTNQFFSLLPIDSQL